MTWEQEGGEKVSKGLSWLEAWLSVLGRMAQGKASCVKGSPTSDTASVTWSRKEESYACRHADFKRGANQNLGK